MQDESENEVETKAKYTRKSEVIFFFLFLAKFCVK